MIEIRELIIKANVGTSSSESDENREMSDNNSRDNNISDPEIVDMVLKFIKDKKER